MDITTYTQTFRLFGNLSKAYYEKVGEQFLVYARSDKKKGNKIVNTHGVDTQREAVSLKNLINNI